MTNGGAITRRQLLLGSCGSLVVACGSSPVATPTSKARDASRSLAEIEASVGGRIGVYALDTGSGRFLAHRPDERFALCSTFKLALVGAVLGDVERARLSLSERVNYGPKDLLEHAPSTREHVAAGAMTVEALAEATLTKSDNTAANLLLAKIGGPVGFTKFVRAQGDTVTRLDRNEPSLNENEAGDPRDTTSPKSMIHLMRRLLCDGALTAANRDRLVTWMRESKTGMDRIRAGLPPEWKAGDKTGTGDGGAVNDIAIAWPPNRPPILIAVYATDSEAEMPVLAAMHARVAKLVAKEL